MNFFLREFQLTDEDLTEMMLLGHSSTDTCPQAMRIQGRPSRCDAGAHLIFFVAFAISHELHSASLLCSTDSYLHVWVWPECQTGNVQGL